MDAHLAEEIAFADAEYRRLGSTVVDARMLLRYREPTEMWDWRQRAASLIAPVEEMPSPRRMMREKESTTRNPSPVGQAISSRQLLVPRSSAA